jgi:hypothetical protein
MAGPELPHDVRLIRNVLRGPQPDLPPCRVTFVFSWHHAKSSLRRKVFQFATCDHLTCNDFSLLLEMLYPGFAFKLSLLDPFTLLWSRSASPDEKLVLLKAPLYVRYDAKEPSVCGQPLDEFVHFSGYIASINHQELWPMPEALSHVHGSVPLSSVGAAGLVSSDHVDKVHRSQKKKLQVKDELFQKAVAQAVKEVVRVDPNADYSKAYVEQKPPSLVDEELSHRLPDEELWPPMFDVLSDDLHGSAPLNSVNSTWQPLDEVVHFPECIASIDPEAMGDVLSDDSHGSAPSSPVRAGKSFELLQKVTKFVPADLDLPQFHNERVTDQFECFVPFTLTAEEDQCSW